MSREMNGDARGWWVRPLSAMLLGGVVPAAIVMSGSVAEVRPAAGAADEKKADAPAPEAKKAEATKEQREFLELYEQFVGLLNQQGRYDIASNVLEKLVGHVKSGAVDDAMFVTTIERNRRALKHFEAIADAVPRLKADLEAKKELSPSDKSLLELCNKFPEFMKEYRERRVKIATDEARIDKLIQDLDKAEPVYRDMSLQLKIAGPHALPGLLRAYDAAKPDADKDLIYGIERVIREYLQADALDGLMATLKGTKSERLQEFTARMLGEIKLPASAPLLKEVSETMTFDIKVRDAAAKSLKIIADPEQQAKSVARLYYDLADAYYKDKVTPKPVEAALTDVWVWEKSDAGARLVGKKVAYPAYKDAQARRFAWDAIRTGAGNEYLDAWGLFLCSYHRFQAAQAAAAAMEADPLVAVEKWQDSDYTTAVAGPIRIVAALKRALDPTVGGTAADTAMTVKLLKALALTGGRGLLRENREALEVISMGLTHPNQLIRIETAINAVQMHPGVPNQLWSRVVPVLSEAVLLSGKPSVLTISNSPAVKDALGNALADAGFTVARASTLDEAGDITLRQAGFAAVVIADDVDPSAGVVGGLKRVTALPVLQFSDKFLLVAGDRVEAVQGLAKAVSGTATVFAVDAAKDAAALATFIKENVKPKQTVEAAASEAYTLRAIALIKEMAAAGDIRVYNYMIAEPALASAVAGDARESVASAAAGALGLFASAGAQRALAAGALKADRPEPVRLAALAGLAESGRKHRNQLTGRTDAATVQGLSTLSQDTTASQPLRTAAAAALGALDLQGGKLFDLLKPPTDGTN